LIDKNPEAPATGLCNLFIEFEFNNENRFPLCNLKIDLILPAIEDEKVLEAIKSWADIVNIPLAFDLDAYSLSSSKIKSDALFQRMNLPAPKPFPSCPFPVVLKPDQASGSQGVKIINTPEELYSRFPSRQLLDNIVIQEYMEGPSFSIEVMGQPGNYQAIQITDLGMDPDYDCNKVTAPTILSKSDTSQFKEMAVKIAQKIKLKGIMDIEVILNQNELKLLEIDARLPSQTPIAVYWSTGVNMVESLADLFVKKNISPLTFSEHPVLLEHIKVTGNNIAFLGEHIMAQGGPLSLNYNFFGANEAITNFEPYRHEWVATMIFTGTSHDDIRTKRTECYDRIVEHSRHAIMEQVK
jgi:pyrrolysine biosynthesis protein PylC